MENTQHLSVEQVEKLLQTDTFKQIAVLFSANQSIGMGVSVMPELNEELVTPEDFLKIMAENKAVNKITEIVAENQELKADLAFLKNNVLQICTTLGLYENSKFVERVNMIRLMPKVMGYLSDHAKLKKDFGFIIEMAPLLEKYKDL